jgi:hypothetical protein
VVERRGAVYAEWYLLVEYDGDGGSRHLAEGRGLIALASAADGAAHENGRAGGD